jgi:hypothetical protein
MSQAFDGIVHPITAPTLIRDSDNDQYLKGQPHLAEKALASASATRGAAAGVGDVGVAGQAMAAGSCRRFSTTLVTLTEKRGRRGAHPRGHAGGLGRTQQAMFDGLDTTLTACGRLRIQAPCRSK